MYSLTVISTKDEFQNRHADTKTLKLHSEVTAVFPQEYISNIGTFNLFSCTSFAVMLL